jgi:hypothetical protein
MMRIVGASAGDCKIVARAVPPYGKSLNEAASGEAARNFMSVS